MKVRGAQIGEVVSITPSFAPNERTVDIPVVVELIKGSVKGFDESGVTLDQLIQDGLRARLELASLITGQLYVGLNIIPGAPLREARIPPATCRSLHSPRCNTDCRRALTDLLADRPKIEKGLDQMLELLNLMVAGGGAEQITLAMAAATQLLEKMSDPQGPLFATLDRLPPLIANLDQTAKTLPPVLEQAGQTLGAVNDLAVGPEAPVTPLSPTCRRASPTCAGWATNCRRW